MSNVTSILCYIVTVPGIFSQHYMLYVTSLGSKVKFLNSYCDVFSSATTCCSLSSKWYAVWMWEKVKHIEHFLIRFSQIRRQIFSEIIWLLRHWKMENLGFFLISIWLKIVFNTCVLWIPYIKLPEKKALDMPNNAYIWLGPWKK